MGRGIYCAGGEAAVTQEEELKVTQRRRGRRGSQRRELALLRRTSLKEQRYIEEGIEKSGVRVWE
jgi:hypothetical protein